MNYKISLLALALIASVGTVSAQTPAAKKAAPAAAAKPAAGKAAGKIATVNGNPISESLAQLLVDEQLSQGQQDSADLRAAVKDELIKREVLAQEARKLNFDKTEAVASRIELARQSILLGAYLDDYVAKHPVPESTIKAEYDRQVQLAGDKEYKVRHIQTEKESDAVAIIKQLDSGAKFDTLVKESKDLGSKDNGGDLGWMRPQGSFKDAIVLLDKGNYTKTPVKTEFGFHVILLEDVRKPEIPAYDQVKERVRQALVQQVIQKHVAELLSRAKID